MQPLISVMDLLFELQRFSVQVSSGMTSLWWWTLAETSMRDGNTAAKSKANLNAHDMAASNVADAAVALVITQIA